MENIKQIKEIKNKIKNREQLNKKFGSSVYSETEINNLKKELKRLLNK